MVYWYLFSFVEFLFRVILHAMNLFRTYRWPEQNAKVMSAEYSTGLLGCPEVTIDYEYPVGGIKYASSYSKPFILKDSAIDCARDLSSWKNVDVRVSPNDPSASVYLRS